MFVFDHTTLRTLYGLGYPRQPSPRDNFTKRLYENCVTEPQLTLLNYAYILRRNKHHDLPLFLCSSSFISIAILTVTSPNVPTRAQLFKTRLR